MSEPPPAYSEAPHEDLTAELAKMKAMMEQMRLDKERMEMEAKRKAEEDAAAARIRAEQEEARELAEIHKRLYANMTAITNDLEERNKLLLDSILQRGEVLLFLDGLQGGCIVGMRYGGNSGKFYLSAVITDKHIYRFQTHYETGHVSAGTVYTFDHPLRKRDITLLENLLRHVNNYKNGVDAIVLSQIFDMGNEQPRLDKQKRFESVIRLIPGSYRNGDWRQLDGFFGMYFNETTMEVSEVPPSL